jgi:peptide/nickel transport system substrate-binding protein
MSKGKFMYLFIVIILIVGTMLVGCSQTTPAKPTAPAATTSAAASVQTGGILTIISPQTPESFGLPAKQIGNAPGFCSVPVLESFIDSDIKGNLKPKLATSWETAADLSSITYHLRQGVKFHDGTDFNADATKWNLDQYLKRGTGAPSFWKNVEKIDDYTVRVNLKQYDNTQLTQNYYMVSPTAVQQNGEDWAITHPVGTGPFKFKNFVRSTSLEFERFDGYWGDKARLDGVKYVYIVDPTTAAMAFKGGDGQVWESADPKTAYDMKTKSGFKIETRRGPMPVLLPDSAHPDSPVAKLKVRQAIWYAINRKEIVDSLGFGTWEAVDQPNVPEQFGHVDGLASYPYNPAKAKQLLAEAGYSNGFSINLISLTTWGQDPITAIQANLAAVGIKANVDIQDPAKWAGTRVSGWTNGLFFHTQAATDFNYCAYLQRYYIPGGLFVSPAVTYPDGWVDSMKKLLATSDPAAYKPMAQALVKQWVENAIAIPLWAQSEVYLQYPYISEMGVGTHGDGFTWNANKVWIGKH